ncbi:MAG TPA: HEAT repeat domain-containing protein [Acidobacteriota bacterium]
MKRLSGLVLFFLMLTSSAPAKQTAQQTQDVSIDSLIYDLKNPDPQRRREAVRTLAKNKARAAVPALIEAFQDDEIRLDVLRALASINDPRALDTYVAAAKDRRMEVRGASIEGMVDLYVVEEGGFIHQTKKIIDALNPFEVDYDPLVVEPYIPVNGAAVNSLSILLSDPDAKIRRRAAQAVGVLRGEEAAPALVDALKKETDSGVKMQMIRAIYKIRQTEYGVEAIPFIEDENKSVHDEAIRTVGFLRVKEAVEPLTRLYNSEPEERRRILKVIPATGKDDLQFKLLDALAYIGAPESQSIFARNLQHRNADFRRAAAEGMGRAGLKESIPLLQAQKQVEDKPEALLAIHFALYRLGNDLMLVELINGLDSALYDQALEYLLESSPEETKKLYPFVRLKRKKVQLGLLEVLGRAGGVDAMPLLQELSADRDSEVASAANQAIRRLRARTH